MEDDSQAPMYTACVKYGGEQGLGLPITLRVKDPVTGRFEQAFQKARIQLTVDASGKVVKEEFENTFDEVEKRNINLNRSPYFIPPTWTDWSSDQGKTFGLTADGQPAPDSIWQNHIDQVLHLPFKSKNPIPKEAAQAIEAKYLEDPNFTIKYGTVVSIESYENGALVVARTQRAAFQYWRDATPWTNNQPGQVVVANGCDIAKQVGLYSPDITTPKELPTGGGGNGSNGNGTEIIIPELPYPKEVGILERDGIVLHNLSSEIGIIITDQKYFQEKMVPLIKKYRPNGVEFFFHDRKTPFPFNDSSKYRSFRTSGYFPNYYGSLLSDTPVDFAERHDGVLEVHYGLFVTNPNPTPETIRIVSYGLTEEGMIRYIEGDKNLGNPDVLAGDKERYLRYKEVGYPIFMLHFNKTVTPIATSG